MGGRPNTDPIQGVGGVKGAQVYSFADILSYAEFATPQTEDTSLVETLSVLTSLPIDRSSATAVNLRDQILPDNLEDGTPAQFIAEEADCRLYWTAAHVKDITALWKSAATAKWDDGDCVAGAGLKKRKSTVVTPKKKMTRDAVHREALGRRVSIKRMELELAQPDAMFKSKYGKKIVS